MAVLAVEWWVILAGTAIGGVGLGFGLVIGAFVARALRHYMRDEGLDGKS